LNGTDTILVSIAAVVTAIGTAVKQFYDNKAIKRWICTREPCDKRIKPLDV